jgi:hypothetical protein
MPKCVHSSSLHPEAVLFKIDDVHGDVHVRGSFLEDFQVDVLMTRSVHLLRAHLR